LRGGLYRVGATATAPLRLGVWAFLDSDLGAWDLQEFLELEMHAPARRLQACARGLLVRRCLLPRCVLQHAVATDVLASLHHLSVPDLYLRPSALRLSWLYCDRRTRFIIADALHLGVRRCTPQPAAGGTNGGKPRNAKAAGKLKKAAAACARPWRGVAKRALANEFNGVIYRAGCTEAALHDEAMLEKLGLRDQAFGDLFRDEEDLLLCDFMDWDPWDNANPHLGTDDDDDLLDGNDLLACDQLAAIAE
jgi:hypothetical protein